MRKKVKNDLTKSAKAFKEVVWPNIENWFNGGKIIPVEAVTENKMAKKLDMLSGIDAWHIKNNKGIRGIASRIQWTNRPYNTFTIRKERESGAKTEYEKRKEAIKNNRGWLYPEITTQAYLKNKENELLSVGAIRTKNLINFILTNNPPIKSVDHDGKAKFFVVNWEKLDMVKVLSTGDERNEY